MLIFAAKFPMSGIDYSSVIFVFPEYILRQGKGG